MLRPRHKKARRRAVILMVVLALLTLFTIVGIAFVYISDSYALSAKNDKDAQSILRPEISPEMALSYVLSQLIYDVNDDALGAGSSLRGHGLARNMYGWNHTPANLATYLPNEVPYSGVGRLRLTSPFTGFTEQDLINFRYLPGDTYRRDPERLQTAAEAAAQARGSAYVCGAVPYTYPDANNAFLAVLDPTTNRIVLPSFHRPWLFGALNDSTNLNWTTNPAGRYLTLRPRPNENPNFGIPTDPGGDVKNYDGGAGGNDSIWIDVNAPILIAPNGQRYKWLVAPLIIELDSRLNLNAHGNISGPGNSHAGNMGWGPFEVDLSRLFPLGNTEYPHLFLGTPVAGVAGTPASPPRILGKYCPGVAGNTSFLPIAPATPPAGSTGSRPRPWGNVDINGLIDPGQAMAGGLATLYTLPSLANNPTSPWPTFPLGSYGYGAPQETTSTGLPGGTFIHPLAFNPIRPAPGNRLLPLLDIVAMLRTGGTNAEFLPCDTTRLCPNAFSMATNNGLLRRLTTTASFDLDRAGIVPYLWNPYNPADPSNTLPPYILSADPVTGAASVSQAALPTNPLFTANQTPAAVAAAAATLPANSEFEPAPGGGTTFRSVLAQITKLNLNTPLTPYPAPNTTTGAISTTDPDLAQAILDRQNFAQRIFNRLQQVTGALPPASVDGQTAGATKTNQWNALRYLAQVAVNMVDFIDQDGYSTPFRWWTTTGGTSAATEWVYGVEVPRLVLNEVYTQINNNPMDTGIYSDTTTGVLQGTPLANTFYYSNFWVELMNPFPAIDAADTLSQSDVPARLAINNGSTTYPVYQVVLAANSASAALKDPRNQTGDPNFNSVGTLAGDTTTGSGTISNLPANSTTNLAIGMTVTGNGIPANARITVINSGTSITLSGNATATAAGESLTFLSVRSTVSNFPTTATVMPVGTGYATADTTGAGGFYVVGPVQTGATATATGSPIPFPTAGTTIANPNLTVSLESPGMSIQVPLGTTITGPGGTPATPQYTVVLQRLLCPGLPPNTDQASPLYNPYVTVDYIDTSTSTPAVQNDFRYHDDAGPLATVPVVTNFRAQERLEPWVATPIQRCALPTSTTVTIPTTQPYHTFFRHNGISDTLPAALSPQLNLPFRWLVHMDRQVVSKSELMHVSYCKPHELTQLFHQTPSAGLPYAYPATYSRQVVPWTDPNTRLYRFLELVDVPSRMVGVGSGDRTPGRVNLNGVYPAVINGATPPLAHPTFQAILNNQGCNEYTSTQVDTFASTLLSSRTPNFNQTTPSAQPAQIVGGSDQPYWGLGLGASAANALCPPTQTPGIGPVLSNTLISGTTLNSYAKTDFLNKIFNNTTTRSNVFAVWLTVGFFEVDSSGALGAEIGVTEGRQVRHRMFAIVDRTGLTVLNTNTTAAIPAPATPPPALTPTNLAGIMPASWADPRTGRTWAFRNNSRQVLVFEPNTANQETVVATTDATGATTATFRKGHALGVPVISRGNPGPWLRYDPRQDTEVVPYYAVIE